MVFIKWYQMKFVNDIRTDIEISIWCLMCSNCKWDFVGYSKSRIVLPMVLVRLMTKTSYYFQIWNTNSGDRLAEWKPSNGDHDIGYSCIACSFTGKKVLWTFRGISCTLLLFYAGILLFSLLWTGWFCN